jgi:uncharacterized membrane protein YkvA (DUF1232 family)
VPILGYLDDLLIVPLGVLLAARLIPADVMAELRGKAETAGRRPRSLAGLAVIVAIWCLLLAGLAAAFLRR